MSLTAHKGQDTSFLIRTVHSKAKKKFKAAQAVTQARNCSDMLERPGSVPTFSGHFLPPGPPRVWMLVRNSISDFFGELSSAHSPGTMPRSQ
jgi:hypothetical protein